ncbi:MAG TPA: metallophosphoesterase [Candidatus Sulfotelmatobacter sp.]|nr:metallophosphoesterase [Candidatus Sulfotelmatobacter sp.]
MRAHRSGSKVPHELAFSTNRRRFLKLAAAAGVGAIGVDSVFFEPNRPEVVRQDLKLARWPAALDGFTVALLSDFHYDPYFSEHPLHRAIPLVKGLNPDMIVLTGDFVSVPVISSDYEKAAAAAEPCAHILKQMSAPYGLWAVLGNHDDATDPARVAATLNATGIPVLANKSVPIELKGSRFWLSGVNDVLSRTADLKETLAGIPRGEATILMAHEPDYADHTAKYPVDLQLSGHSHGGQVRLPFLPPLYEPVLARKYFAGLYRVGPLTLYTNRGIGTTGLAIRWNCPPEVTLLTLRHDSAA